MPIDSARLERIRKYNASQRAAEGMEPKSTAPKSGLRNPDAVRRFQESMRRANPDIVGRSSNTTETALARRPSAEVATRSGGELVKRTSGEIATRQGGELVRRASGEMVKAGSNSRPIGLNTPPPARELVRAGANAIPKGGELIRRESGELVRKGAPAAAAMGSKAGMGIFGPLAAAAAIAAADKATDYKRAKYTQNSFGPQFDLNPYASSNERMSKGMKYGMGATDKKVFERGHLTGFGGPVEDLLGYGVSLVQRGRNFDDAKKLITGTEKFRKLSEPVQQAVLSHYDFWRASQSKGKNTARMVDDMTKPAMRRPAGEPMPR